MKFRHPETVHEYALELHPRAHQVALDFESESLKRGWPEPTIVDIKRTPEQNAAAGGSPTSWHLLACAIDFSVRDYTPEQHAEVIAWFERRCEGSEWELITKPHGSGPHVHVSFRDFGRRRNRLASPQKE